jgi:heat shock protein HtpX
MTYDFFATPHRMRQRTWLLIAALVLLLWLLTNLFLIGLHSRRSCATGTAACQTTYHANAAVLLITAVCVGGYLFVASLVTSRAMVSGPGIRAADGADTAVLRNVVAEVALAAGTPAPRAFVVDDPSLNAYAVSDGRRHGAVVVTSGLLATMDRRELTGVVAHELAHIRNRDSRVLVVAMSAVGVVLIAATVAVALASVLVRAVRGVSKGGGLVIFGALALVAVVAAMLLRLLALPAAMLLRAAPSRRREELADASAVQFTRDPGGLRRALEKVAADTSAAQQIRPLARALCIEQPWAGGAGWLDRWMASHPPIGRRISWLRSLKGGAAA